MKTAGKLIYGVTVGDAVHYDYTVALPVIRHTVRALAATFEAMGETESPSASMYYRAAVMAEALVSLGPLNGDEITADILLDSMTDEDFDLIDAELAGIKKKRINSKPDSPDSDAQHSSSVDTASAVTP
ncbi:hypothetical protein [Pantoea ananatis]|uniref:hypothetical protein n=1 Tax=Pantoea ananas TaxID=553 RepID=UPI003CF6B6B2